MLKSLSSIKKAYVAGFLDADGSIYVRAKPNPTYRYGFQVAPYVVFFQSAKDREGFARIEELVGYGRMRERGDGILEYVISKVADIREFLSCVQPYLVLKQRQATLMLQIFDAKERVEKRRDFENLLKLIDSYRRLNYSKNRKERTLTP